jgi:hypothetical protein
MRLSFFCAPPAFELFFPGDVAAKNVDAGAGHSKMLASSWLSAPGKDPARRGSVVESSEQHGQDKPRRGPSTPRRQTLYHAINR